MSMKPIRGAGLLLAVLSAAVVAGGMGRAGAALAYSERVKAACKNDYLRFCPNYEVGTPSLRACMTQAGKRSALTPRCVNALIDAGEVPRRHLKR